MAKPKQPLRYTGSIMTRHNSRRSKSEESSAENGKNSFFYSIVVLGGEKVGKTNLIKRFIDNSFSPAYVPTISEVYEKTFVDDEKFNVTFCLYDTSGSIDFPAMTRLTISKSHACIIVFNVNLIASLKYAERKLEEFNSIHKNNCPRILVGNMTDTKRRQVTVDDAEACAKKYSCTYIETSALENANVADVFRTLLNLLKVKDKRRTKEKRPLEIRRSLNIFAS